MTIISKLFEQHLPSQSPSSDTFWGYALPLIEKLQKDGVSFFFKSDGERDTDIYTVMIEGAPLNGDFFKTETDELESGIEKVISEYAMDYWN